MPDLKFVYATDLHGNESKYENVLKYAETWDIKLIHLGADLLPKGKNMAKLQKKFVKGYLKQFYKRCEDLNIKVLAFWGNDDIVTRQIYFKQYGSLLTEEEYSTGKYLFHKAYPYVPDYKWNLKNFCKLDYEGWKRPEQLGDPVEFLDKKEALEKLKNICCQDDLYLQALGRINNGIWDIKDIDKYFKDKKTIEQDLKKIKIKNKNTIMSFHSPPSNLLLDVVDINTRPGSKSIFDWIKREQPLLVLCGHIHESPENIIGGTN